MKKNTILVLICSFLLMSCSRSEKVIELSDIEIKQLEKFSDDLYNSLIHKDYKFLRSSFSNKEFDKRIKGLSSSEQSVKNYALKDLNLGLGTELILVELANKIRYDSVKVVKLNFYTENRLGMSTLMTQKGDSIQLFQIALKLSKNTPKVIDYYYLHSDMWLTEKISDAIKLNNKFRPNNQNTLIEIGKIQRYLYLMEENKYCEALEALKSVSFEYRKLTGLNIQLLHIAKLCSPSLYRKELEQIKQHNPSIYLEYLAFKANTSNRFDSIAKNQFKIPSAVIENLENQTYLW